MQDWTKPIILRIHKESGFSSYDCIRVLKKKLPKTVKKIGYFGTLDPFAEGLLLVSLNQASRLTQFVHSDLTKTYRAVGILGGETATQDLTSDIIQKDQSSYFHDVISTFDKEFYHSNSQKFVGVYHQSPPIYSAAKFEGKKLCDWARNDGIEIKKESVERKIYKLNVLDVKFPEITFEVECSSGTYIRTLFVDMANLWGTLGYLVKLKRIQIGNVKNDDSLKVDNFTPEDLNYQVGITDLLPYPQIRLNEKQGLDFFHGRTWQMSLDNFRGNNFWAISQEEKLMGLSSYSESDGVCKSIIGLH